MNRGVFFILVILFCAAAKTATAAETLPLAGQWRFALDRNDVGTNEHWFSKTLPDTIQLPGILEAQGYGDEISTSTPWVLSLYDHYWFLRADYAAYTNSGRVKVPFLCQPQRHYVGAAWYQRDVEIPADWAGKRMTLFLERPHWKSTVWLDDKEIGSDISLCTAHEYDLGTVVAHAGRLSVSTANENRTGGTPVPLPIPEGRHQLTIRVDNRMILPYRPDAHSISDSLDDAWNGVVGKIELRARSPVWIDDVRIFPNVKDKSVHALMTLHNLSGEKASGKIEFYIDSCPGTKPMEIVPSSENFNDVFDTNSQVQANFDLGDQTRLWDEFSPALYRLRVEVRGATDKLRFDECATNTFGLRDFHTVGNQFMLNNRPLYFRGTHFGGDFPLTGYPPTDVESWKKILETCKNYGLNHMRFHSWCPPEAAFEAADELGFYLQVECGMWNEISPGSRMEAMLYDETERILHDFGNHPSLMMISAMNEAHGNWQPVLSKWVKHFRAADPRHLYTPDTGWSLVESPGQPLDGGADYLAVGRIGPNRVRGEPGWFGGDYGDSVSGVSVPVIGHEVGQWCAYPDFDIIRKFTGFMRPGNFEIFRDSAAAHGLLDQDKDFAWASGRFQLECYKEEIEANLRTPGLSGFQLLDLHDYTGQGTALVGLLDPFWESKGYVAPEEFKEFCNVVVPLVRLPKRIFTTADKFTARLEMANFGATPLTNVTIVWGILDRNGDRKAGGTANVASIPIGKNIPVPVKISAELSSLPAPGQYQLEVALRGTTFSNCWNFWLYPAQIAEAIPANVMVTSSWDQAEKELAAGGRVLFLPHNADLDWSSPPLARVPVFWNALMGPTWSRMLGLWCDTNSPALAGFPTEANCDWQWTELLNNTRAINLDKLPRDLKPIVSAIDDWNRNYKLGLIFEARVGAGKLLVCSANLDGNSSPVALQLRRSLLDYMGSNMFQPGTGISQADFESLHFDTTIMRQLGATATADGRNASSIVDGDPNTFWSSADARGNGPKPPHEIQITFPQPAAMSGLVLMPRQNQREHQGDIREFKLESSNDQANWKEIASGQLASTFDEQKIIFGRTLTAKYLRLTGLSGFGTDHAAALAELAIIYAGPQRMEENRGNIEYKNIRTASPDIDAGNAPAGQPKK